MTVNIMARRLAPMVILGACLLSGCQSMQTVSAEPQSFAAVAHLEEREQRESDRQVKTDASVTKVRSTEPNRWRERAKEMRAAYRERLEKRRAERRKNTVAMRPVSDPARPARSARSNHLDGRDDRSARWGNFKRFKKPDAKQSQAKPQTGKSKGKFGSLIAKYAQQHGVPFALARAVVQVESSFRPNVTGGAGEIGLMQIKYATAKGMGYTGSRKQLYDPATNLYWGMKYLGRAHQLAGGNTCGTILRYNAGHYAKRMNPISSRYCQKVRRILA